MKRLHPRDPCARDDAHRAGPGTRRPDRSSQHERPSAEGAACFGAGWWAAATVSRKRLDL